MRLETLHGVREIARHRDDLVGGSRHPETMPACPPSTTPPLRWWLYLLAVLGLGLVYAWPALAQSQPPPAPTSLLEWASVAVLPTVAYVARELRLAAEGGIALHVHHHTDDPE